MLTVLGAILLTAVFLWAAILQGWGVALGALGLIGAILGIAATFLTFALGNESNRQWLADWLEKAHGKDFHWGDRHRELWGRFLGYLERKIGRKKDLPIEPPEQPFLPQLLFFFRIRVLGWWLPFALCYPAVLLMLSWMGGGLFELGGQIMDLTDLGLWIKLLVIISLLGTGVILYALMYKSGLIFNWLIRRINGFLPNMFKKSQLFYVFIIFAFISVIDLAVAGAFVFFGAGAGAFAVAGAFVVAGAVTSVRVGVFPLAAFRTLTSVHAFVFAFAFAGPLAALGGQAFKGFGADAVAVAGVGALAFAMAFSIVLTGAVSGGLAAAGFLPIAFAGATGVIEGSYIGYNLLLLYLLLPFINAFADYLSWGLSRWLLWGLTTGKEKRPLSIVKAAIDLLAVLGFLILLSWSLPFFLGAASSLLQWFIPTAKVIDLPGYIDAAARGPFSEGLAVSGMLLTTFLPTSLHLMALTVSLCLPYGSREVTDKLLKSLKGDPDQPHHSGLAVMVDLGRLVWVIFALPVLMITSGLLILWLAYVKIKFVSDCWNWFFSLLREIALASWGWWGL